MPSRSSKRGASKENTVSASMHAITDATIEEDSMTVDDEDAIYEADGDPSDYLTEEQLATEMDLGGHGDTSAIADAIASDVYGNENPTDPSHHIHEFSTLNLQETARASTAAATVRPSAVATHSTAPPAFSQGAFVPASGAFAFRSTLRDSVHATQQENPQSNASKRPRASSVENAQGAEGDKENIFEDGDEFERKVQDTAKVVTTGLSSKEILDPVKFLGRLCGAFDDDTYPTPYSYPTDPEANTTRMTVMPRPPPNISSDFAVAIFQKVQSGLDKLPNMPSFTTNGKMDKPIVTLPVRNGRTVVDVKYSVLKYAAAFSRVQELQLTINSVNYRLRHSRSGRCHARSLVTIHMNPVGGTTSVVQTQAYLDAASKIFTAHPRLTPVGAWRLCNQWSDGDKTLLPLLVVVAKRTADFQPEQLPGFVNDAPPSSLFASFRPTEPQWFHLKYADRQPYCKHCKTSVHSQVECPLVKCKSCFSLVHDECGNRKQRRVGPLPSRVGPLPSRF